MRAKRMLLWAGVLSGAIYIVTDVLASRLYPGFSYADQAVSELFAIGAPTSRLVVVLFSISSVLLLCFALGIWRIAVGHRALRALTLSMACGAIVGLLLWNFFPMHQRGDPKSFTDTMHLALATNPFMLLMYVLGVVAFHGSFRRYTIATIVVLLVLAVYGFSFAPEIAANEPSPWMGLAERAAQYIGCLWEMALAIVLDRGISRPSPERVRRMEWSAGSARGPVSLRTHRRS